MRLDNILMMFQDTKSSQGKPEAGSISLVADKDMQAASKQDTKHPVYPSYFSHSFIG